MRYRPRVFSVNDLFDWYQKNELRLNPNLCRGGVQEFVDVLDELLAQVGCEQ
jgi:hypothetical protein